MFPGGGYFYTRHYFIGLLNAIVEVFLLGYFYLIQQDLVTKTENRTLYLAGLAASFVAVKIISVIHSTHFVDEFIPRRRKIQTKRALARSRPKKQKSEDRK